MNDTQYLTKCIGQELRFVFANAMEVHLDAGHVYCLGSMPSDEPMDYDKTEIKLVFGNRMTEGFYLSSQVKNPGTEPLELALDLRPLAQYDDKFSKCKLKTSEVLKSIKRLSKDTHPSLYLGFESGNSFLISAIEEEQNESSIGIQFVSGTDEGALQGYEVLEVYEADDA